MSTYEQYIRLVDGSFVWDMHATHGIPVEITLEELWNRRLMPTWDRLLWRADKDGTNTEKLSERIILIVEGIYPKHIADYIATNLKAL